MAIKKKPVSPRQKMINLMYVVLMAMLALNVSTEVLNGFSIVEESDKGYNQPAYDTATKQYTIQWTWCLYEEVELDAP